MVMKQIVCPVSSKTLRLQGWLLYTFGQYPKVIQITQSPQYTRCEGIFRPPEFTYYEAIVKNVLLQSWANI